MFTGIIETMGTITRFKGGRLSISVPWDHKQLHIGQSVAVDGCCLTIVGIEPQQITFDLSPETIRLTAFAQRKEGNRINLERGMALGNSMDGHLVTGHIDTCCKVRKLEKVDDAGCIEMWFDVPPSYEHWYVNKGSVAIDGISLTVCSPDADGFSVALIPHTLEITTLGLRKVGDPVNVEFDLIAKYVERLLAKRESSAQPKEFS